MIYKQEIKFLNRDVYDLLIVGGGAVGLSLASSLSFEGINICVVESGLDCEDSKYDKLKYVETSGLNIKPNSRERMIGGSGQTWNGILANFDICDFNDRGNNYPALGIDQNEIKELLDKFGKFFKIPKSKSFNLSRYPNSQLELGDPFEQKVFLEQNPVFKFGDRLKHIFERPGIDLISGWTVSNLEWEESICKGIMITNLKGEKKFLYGKKVILCCGTIENIRLLKLSQIKGKLSATLPVGKYFMNHPKGVVGKIKFNEPILANDTILKLPKKQGWGFAGFFGLRFTDAYVTANNLSNNYIRIFIKRNRFMNSSSYNFINFLKTFPGISKSLIFRWFAQLMISLWRFRNGLFGLIYEIFLILIKNFSFKKIREADVEVLSEISSKEKNQVSFSNNMQNTESIIPHVSHSLSSNDLRSIENLLKKFHETIARNKIGKIIRFKKSLQELVVNDASHHIGGTRISLNGDEGVVTKKLKVIGSENLYVCGGSVLRASGHANPTMFFIGMSLKLAKHIKTEIGIPSVQKSFFEIDFENKINQNEIVIIGAGKRVREDVLPVFESIIKNQENISIYAKHESGIFGRSQAYLVKSINDLSASDLKSTKIIYVAVPVHEAVFLAEKLKDIVQEHIKIIWDTPISKNGLNALNIFKKNKMFVAEDSSYLPWLEIIENKKDIKLNQILIDKGGYMYNAAALVSEIQRKINGEDFLQKLNIKKSKTELSYNLGNEEGVIVKLKKSHKEGKIELFYNNGSKVVLGGEGNLSNIKIIRNKYGLCSGFYLGNKIHKLSKIETDLMGYVHEEDDIVKMMLQIKRVGLRRLILDVYNDKAKLEIADANADAILFNY